MLDAFQYQYVRLKVNFQDTILTYAQISIPIMVRLKER